MNNISQIVLIYKNDDDDTFEQPLSDLQTAGTLTDPETGDDLELIGWKFAADCLYLQRTATQLSAERLDQMLAAWDTYDGDVSGFYEAWLAHINKGKELPIWAV
ncbi:MAG: hypothetical protein B5766_05395 [Candidatus Lumbricidophila eiseniae]|uniref:Uncharacterized protein n=1 Tax=Candidatus Lumbricidiphila eiseniae TaxID=1969409 RepID=A0A2A6FSD0_9MICO|nr:MAG: hypothetical protein B5766_05395 [Candidatus Lumbricidophila eiseniae]